MVRGIIGYTLAVLLYGAGLAGAIVGYPIVSLVAGVIVFLILAAIGSSSLKGKGFIMMSYIVITMIMWAAPLFLRVGGYNV